MSDPPPQMPAWGCSVFLRIWCSIFLAASATFFLLMTLSAKVFAGTGSALASNTIVLTQWLPAVLALFLIRVAVARYSPRRLLVFCELGSAAVLPLVPALMAHFLWLIALLLVKGGFDALSKVSRTVALKRYFSGKALDGAASYYNTAALAGGGAGALIGALLLGILNLPGVLAACAAAHLVAAGLYASLPATEQPAASAGAAAAGNAPLDAGVRAAIIYFIAAVCLFQGYHNIARSVFPVTQLGMEEGGIPLVQTLTNFAYIAGAFLASRFTVAGGRHSTVGPALHVLALLTVLPLSFMTQPVSGLAMYALFAFAFEMAYCVHLRYIITASPSAGMARIVADTNAWAVGSMVACSLLGSYAVDEIGLMAVSAAVGCLAAAVPIFIHVLNVRLRAPLAGGRPQES